MPLRFLLVSTHTEQMTGYSKVSHNLLRQLATLSPLVKVFHFGFQRAPMKIPKPMRVLPEGVIQYDAALNEEPREEGFGFNKFKEYVDMVNPDIVMFYNDALVVNRFLQTLGLQSEESVRPSFKIWVYLDQVYKFNASPLIHPIEMFADKIFTFTEAWKTHLTTLLEESSHADKIFPLEHGVDKSVFKCLPPQERAAIRNGMGLPAAGKIFLNVNRNSDRKRLDLSVMAFVELIKRHPETPYYIVFVTTARPDLGGTYDLMQIYSTELKRRGLDLEIYGKRLVVIDNGPPNLISDDAINHLYNACDYGINTSDGEGFGLCQLEHLATGAPQVVLDVGDYRAFLDDECAVFVKPSQIRYLSARFGMGLYSESASPEEVATAMEAVERLADVARCAKKVEKRSWSRICDPFLEMVASVAKKS
jgi:glycosyltransferase involved in cell wall biosynthesis